MVVKTAAAEALVRASPSAVASFAPGDPRVAFGRAQESMRRRRGEVTAPLRAAAEGALAAAPLAHEPFLIAGADALRRGEAEQAERLLEFAKARNPRSRAGRLFLLERYLRTNQPAAAAGEMTVLSRLVPEAAGLLVPEFARLAREPATSSAMVQVLRSDPALRTRVLDHMASSGADPESILRFAASTGGLRGAGNQDWQGRLVEALVKKGEIARAYTLWVRFTGVARPVQGNLLYDPRFRGMAGSPPFNWRLTSGGDGVAERSGDGLQVEYYGRANIPLAEQLLMLSPGSYRFAARVEGEAEGKTGKLVWRASCLGSRSSLFELPVKDLSLSAKDLAAAFRVPAGCSAQWLSLVGVSAEFASAQRLTVLQASIEKTAP